MENRNYFDELIVSYLSKNLNAEEEVFILDWINSSDENRQYFEELRSTWNLLSVNEAGEEINVANEWDLFEQTLGTRQKEPTNTYYEAGYSNVIEQVRPHLKTKIYKFFISTAVAASMLLVITLAWKFVNNNSPSQKRVVVNEKKETLSNTAFIQYELNTTNEVKQFVLSDGSEVRLFSKSKIAFSKPFNGSNRDITLIGKATFIVAKDKTRPFTVFSGDISTTALGTQFTVTAFEKAKNVIVRLYEGKVVVKSTNKAKRKLRDIYLKPGEELVYDNESLTTEIRKFRIENNTVIKNNKKDSYLPDNPSVPTGGQGTWFMFNNQPLAQVFDQLEDMFNADIIYKKREVSKVYFIGTFNKSDSLYDILQVIARTNDFKVTRKDNKFIIGK